MLRRNNSNHNQSMSSNLLNSSVEHPSRLPEIAVHDGMVILSGAVGEYCLLTPQDAEHMARQLSQAAFAAELGRSGVIHAPPLEG